MKSITTYIHEIQKITLGNIVKSIYNDQLRSIESKLIACLMIISLILSFINNVSFIIILFKLSFYTVLLSCINCMIYGGCRLYPTTILLYIIPALGIIIQTLDIMGWFQEQGGYIKKVYDVVKFLSGSHDMGVIFGKNNNDIKSGVKMYMDMANKDVDDS